MFTGIIESLGTVELIEKDETNIHFHLSCDFSSELKIDQSLSHDGVCLTVVERDLKTYKVTAIEETMNKTRLGSWMVGERVNLERCVKVDGRLDGHIVQGHIDTTGIVTEVKDVDGSYELSFKHERGLEWLTVHKGSITINGVSLTVVESTPSSFSVAVIPYTWGHTNFHLLKAGDTVNIEFDVLGKYLSRMLSYRS